MHPSTTATANNSNQPSRDVVHAKRRTLTSVFRRITEQSSQLLAGRLQHPQHRFFVQWQLTPGGYPDGIRGRIGDFWCLQRGTHPRLNLVRIIFYGIVTCIDVHTFIEQRIVHGFEVTPSTAIIQASGRKTSICHCRHHCHGRMAVRHEGKCCILEQ